MSNRLEVQIGADIAELSRKLQLGMSKLEDFGKKAEKIGAKMTSAGKTMTKGLTLPLGILGGTALKAAADLETLETSLSVMTGSAEEGKKLLKELTDFTAKTPFQLEGVGNTAKQLLAFGFSTTQVKENLQFLGDAAAGSGNDLSSLGQIFGQISAAGQLTGERLNQLQERAIPIGSALAKSMGVAESAIKDMTSKGQISFADFEKAFKSLSEEGGIFAGAMDKQSTTIAGIFSTLKDNVNLALGELGTTIAETFDLKQVATDLIKSIQDMVKWFSELDTQTKKTIIIIGGIATAIGPVLVVMGTMTSVVIPALVAGLRVASGAVGLFGSSLTILGNIMLANPIGVVIAAVAGLVYVFTSLAQEITPLVSKWKTLMNLMKSMGDANKFARLQMVDQLEAQKELTAQADKKAKADALAKSNADKHNAVVAEQTALFNLQTKAIEDATNKLVTYNETPVETKEPTEPTGNFNFGGMRSGGSMFGGEMFAQSLNEFDKFGEDLKIRTEGIEETVSDFGLKVNDIINNSVVSGFEGLGTAIGNAMATGGNVLQAAGQALIGSLGSLLSQFGGLIIAAGFASEAFSKMMANPFGGGIAAIAAGTALVALGAAVSSFSKNMGGSSGSSAERSVSGAGGAGSASTVGSTSTSVMQGGGTYIFEIQGTKLVGVLRNTLNRNSSLGGNNLLIP